MMRIMKTIGNCIDCQHWVDPTADHPEVANIQEWRKCSSRDARVCNKKVTHWAYGCIHWEPRPEFEPDLTDESPATRWLFEKLQAALRK